MSARRALLSLHPLEQHDNIFFLTESATAISSFDVMNFGSTSARTCVPIGINFSTSSSQVISLLHTSTLLFKALNCLLSFAASTLPPLTALRARWERTRFPPAEFEKGFATRVVRLLTNAFSNFLTLGRCVLSSSSRRQRSLSCTICCSRVVASSSVMHFSLIFLTFLSCPQTPISGIFSPMTSKS